MAKTRRNSPRWLKWAVGEISKLRDSLTSSLGWRIVGATYAKPYRLDSSRVDYAKARALYENVDDNYKLGAGFAKPVINTTVGFMGVPQFRSEDEDAQAVLDDFFGANTSRMQQTHRNTLRDGDCFVWVTREETEDKALYPEAKTRLVYNIIPPEQVIQIIRHPLTRSVQEYVLKSEHVWLDERNYQHRAIITQRISRERRLIQVDGDIPPGVTPGEERNPWGFIPIVHFRNEGDETEEFGRSDLEAIEPFLKAYHDVLLSGIQGARLHNTPRLKLKLKDVARFLANNFGIIDPKKFTEDGGAINLDGHELLIFMDEEDAQFIEVQSAIGSTEPLLKLLFYCIVDTSETPEFAFGVHTPSSLSSVKEQMPILVRRIARKREHFTEAWQKLARIVLAMTAQAEGKRFSTYATTLLWDDIDPRDGKDVAEELNQVTQALNTALQGGFISLDAAAQFLAQYVETMNDYISDDPEVPGERERIIKTRILQARLEDGELAGTEQQLIDKALGNAGE
ncbi:MAG: phage portal protein [Firmicutes bacterium]|nr:phage portal protein [Bacillota bacterium]